MAQLPQRLYGVVGHPVAQSLSPVLHNWGFSRLGIPGVYMAWDKSAMDLPAFVNAVRSLPVHGVSVTIPGKEAVLALADKLTPAAQTIGAANTLYWEGRELVGTNTDMDGFLYPLDGKRPPAALVLGAGGAARAVLAGLAALGVGTVSIAARSMAQIAQLQADFPCTAVPWEERGQALQNMGPGLVVNVTPLGMYGETCGESAMPEDAWPDIRSRGQEGGPKADSFGHVAYDVVYNPRETVFLRQARDRGWQTIDGLRFFVAQGISQFRLWTGQGLPFAEAMRVVEEALEHRRVQAELR